MEVMEALAVLLAHLEETTLERDQARTQLRATLEELQAARQQIQELATEKVQSNEQAESNGHGALSEEFLDQPS